MADVVFIARRKDGVATVAQSCKTEGFAPRSMGLAARRGETIERRCGGDHFPSPRFIAPRPERLKPCALTAIQKRVLQAVLQTPGILADAVHVVTCDPRWAIRSAVVLFNQRGMVIGDQDGRLWPVAGVEDPGVSLTVEHPKRRDSTLSTIQTAVPRGPWDI